MSNEKLRQESSPEAARELESAKSEHQERLNENREREAREADKATSLESARAEAQEAASKQEKEQAPLPEQSPAEKRKARVADRSRMTTDQSFKRVMKDARKDMSAPSRAFSSVIHNKAVEAVSDATGKTIARPNAILAGSLAAFILVATLVIWAKYAGYALSGFETIAAFVIGWIVGLIFDFIRIGITGKSDI